jgi:hypothetical protein
MCAVVSHQREDYCAYTLRDGSEKEGVMSTASPAVQEFFSQYAHSRSSQDIGVIASQYPDSFMFAGPKGARVAEKAAIMAAFPKGRDFLKSLGHHSTEVLSLDEMRMDEHYLLVRAVFAWRFQQVPAAPIDVNVPSTFIVHLDQAGPRIVFQHEHQDFQQVLRAGGVLPA